MADYLVKRAAEILDYPFDWTAALAAGESISTVATSVSPVEAGGLAIDSGGTTHTNNIASPVVSGGVRGHVYELISTVTTDQGRTDQQRRTILTI